MPPRTTRPAEKTITTLVHDEASRRNIPTAEFESLMRPEQQRPIRVAYDRRDRDLDPQLIWRGKYPGDDIDAGHPLMVAAPPLYIQEKLHPKVLIDDLKRETQRRRRVQGQGNDSVDLQPDLFADFNGLPNTDARTEFYQHDQHWSNRLILGDSLQVMASLAEREGLREKIQCIYFDPPYGIKFNSNFQWSTTNRNVKDGNTDHITREPEQVKAFRDTWRDGIHSYLSYLRDRLTVARELLAPSGSIFVQIGDANVHRIRQLLDEIFDEDNHVSTITLKKTAGQDERLINNVADYIVWFAKDKETLKFRQRFDLRELNLSDLGQYGQVLLEDLTRRQLSLEDFDARGNLTTRGRPFQRIIATSSGHGGNTSFEIVFEGRPHNPTANRHWSTHSVGMSRLIKADRLTASKEGVRYIRYFDDFVAQSTNNVWTDVGTAVDKKYVVETGPTVIQRCILMTTDPGDLVLDPTCGSGTTAYVAEQWGRRWITIDTSRVALALARARIMGARYPYYTLADSPEGQRKEAELRNLGPASTPTRNDIRQGFVYERVPHITLKSIANNAEIDVIWDDYQIRLESLRERLNKLLKRHWQEWEIPREWSEKWPQEARDVHAEWWLQRIARQKAIDSSIAAKAELENLYDRPYEDRAKVRVAGPFTVESLSPHRMLAIEDDDLASSATSTYDDPRDAGNFVQVILDTLQISGVQQADKNARITFDTLQPWPGSGYICAEGRYTDDDGQRKRAGVVIGPEFGTVTRHDLVLAAREAGDANFDVVIACGFNFDAQTTEFSTLGRIRILKARMNADLHMAEDLKNTGKGNLFVIFGEPDIEIQSEPHDEISVKVNGIDVFHPGTGQVTSSEPKDLACWFIDTDYNDESFFVRHAYFLGANDPYKSLQTTLKAEINHEAWESLRSDKSRPFSQPTTGRIAVKVINHLGDEVLKVFTVRKSVG